MNVSSASKEFFRLIDEHVGPFDRPLQFYVFPFDAGGVVNLLTVGIGRSEPFITYVTWDLFGHDQQKRGSFGRYELLATCDLEQWCSEVLTNIGRLGLQEIFEPGDTLDIGSWIRPEDALQGVVLEEAFSTHVDYEHCGLIRCIGVTRPELEFARRHGVPILVQRLKRASIYPRTIARRRESVDLSV